MQWCWGKTKNSPRAVLYVWNGMYMGYFFMYSVQRNIPASWGEPFPSDEKKVCGSQLVRNKKKKYERK